LSRNYKIKSDIYAKISFIFRLTSVEKTPTLGPTPGAKPGEEEKMFFFVGAIFIGLLGLTAREAAAWGFASPQAGMVALIAILAGVDLAFAARSKYGKWWRK